MNASQEDSTYIDIPMAATLLAVSEHALERWIRQGAIPYRRVGDGIVFNKNRLKEWADSRNMTWMDQKPAIASLPPGNPSLVNAIRIGGVYSGILGKDVKSVLTSAMDTIVLPPEVDREALLNKLLEREALASTGIGHGVAVPHPRTPLKNASDKTAISVCFLQMPIDYMAIDGEPVFVLWLMLSPSTKVHLQMLARLGYCLRDESFMAFLHSSPDLDSLCHRLERIESAMETSKRM